jgi:uncharacterized protein YjiS (DUF1127 family)
MMGAYSLLFSERPSAAAASANPFRAFAAWVATVRAKHAQRVALSNLLELDAALLDDLGIDRQDVIKAMQYPHDEAARTLTARRAQTSRDWLAHP